MKSAIRTVLLLFYAVFRRDRSPKTVYYHDVGSKYTAMGTPVDVFLRHMKYVRNGDVVCFDDGFRGIWDYRDVFCQFHLNPKVFVAVRLVGQEGYLTWDEILTLQNEYGVEFQCHTWSHQSLVGPMIKASPPRDEDDSWFNQELVKSRYEIEKHIGRPVKELCFPAGYYSEHVLSRCHDAGYEVVYSSDPIGSDDGYVKARCIAQGSSVMAFRAILNGGLGAFAARYKNKHYVCA